MDGISLNRFRTTFQSATTKEFKGHQSKVHSVAWNNDGRKLASSSIDHTARVYTIDKGLSSSKDSVVLKGHQGDVDQLGWDPTHPDKLATVSVDKTVKIWDIRTPKSSVYSIETEGENINISWHPDGSQLAVGSRDDVISFIDLRGGINQSPIISKKIANDVEINEVQWDYSGTRFFLTTGTGIITQRGHRMIKVFDYPSCELILELFSHTANCYCLDMDPKGRYFAVGSADALITLWDIQEFICLQSFSRLDWPVRTLRFSHDGEFIASGSEDHAIDISHVETGENIYSIPTSAATNAVAWHPSRYLLAYAIDQTDRFGRDDGTVHVFGFTS